MITSNKYIDNTKNVYIPIRLRGIGMTLQCHPQVFQSCPSIIDTLYQDLTSCFRILPPSIHGLLTRIPIWVNVTYIYGPMDDPKILKHTTAHHHRQWLDAVNDLPLKAKGVEIYNCFEYETMRLHWNGCGLILHELCHLIHQLVLKDGLDNQVVLDAFGCALESGLYDEVMRRDWAYQEEEMDAAYATINHKEFFSEISVAFLSRGYDTAFCQWKRRKVDEAGGTYFHDQDHLWQCSPPFMAPEVLVRREAFVRNAHTTGEYDDDDVQNCCWVQGLTKFFQRLGSGGVGPGVIEGKGRLWHKGHCNKFFPFTHGQLKRHDPETFAVFQQLWNEIEQWKDPNIAVRNDIIPCMKSVSKRNSGCWAKIPTWYRCKIMVGDAFQNPSINISEKCIATIIRTSSKDILNVTTMEEQEEEDGSRTDTVSSEILDE